MVVVVRACIIVILLSPAVVHGNDCVAFGPDESSLLQASSRRATEPQKVAAVALQQRSISDKKGSGSTTAATPIKVLILSTPGALQPCCGCPDPDKKRCGCGVHHGGRTLQMAEAIQAGILESSPGAEVMVADLSNESGCPDYETVQGFDAIIAGSPSWNGIPAPDITAFIDKWPLVGLRCKVAAAFSTGGGYYAGIQPVIESFHRMFMTFQMIIVGGPQWNTGSGAAAVSGVWPFETMKESGDYLPVNDVFLTDGRSLGARIGNVTAAMKAVPSLCGDYSEGVVAAHQL